MKGRFFLSLLIVLFATSAVAQTTSHRLQSSKHPDVSTTAASNNQCLVYVAATGKWTPGSCSAGAGDVSKVGTPAQYYLGIWTGDGTLGSVAALGSAGNPLISGGAAANPSFLSVVLAGGTNTFSVTNGTASLDVAAGATLNIDKSLQVATGAVVINGNAGGSSVLTLPNQTVAIGTLTDTKWCKYTAAGTVISCDVDPVTDQVGTLTNTKWCTTDGSVINCTEDAPAGSGDVTDVGDCAGGACYDGSSDGGTYVRLYDGTSAYTGLTAGVRLFTFASSVADSENMTWTLGANDNTILLSSSTGANILNLTGFTVNATSFTAAASASPTILLNDSDAPGTDKEIAKIVGGYVDGADGSENGTLDLFVHEAGTTTSYIQLDGKNTQVEVNKTLALGANNITMSGSIGVTGTRVTKGWFTDVESTNMPTVGGTAILSSLTAPQFTTIELGHASDTTLARSAAGAVTVEGAAVVLIGQTLVTRTEFIPVGWMIDGAAAPAAIATTDLGTRQVKTRAFQGDTADQDLEMFWQAPNDIVDGDGGTAGFQVKWRPIFIITSATAPASGEGVAFALQSCSSGNGDTGDCTVGTASVIADADLDAHVQFDIVYGGWTAMTVTDGAAGEGWFMKLYRDQDNAIDDYAQPVGLELLQRQAKHFSRLW